MNMFQEIKDAVSAKEAASFYGLKIGRGGMTCCPFHNDRHPSMKVDKRFHCFGCGADGDVIDLVSRYFGLSLKDAAIKICHDFGLSINIVHCSPPARAKPKKSDAQIIKETEDHCFKVLSRYLHLLEEWKIKYEPKDMDDVWHPYYCEALKEIDHVRYLLDTLLTGDISDRALLITDYGGKVIELERRIRGFGSENDRSDKGDKQTDE